MSSVQYFLTVVQPYVSPTPDSYGRSQTRCYLEPARPSGSFTHRSGAPYRNQHFFNESGADFSRRSLRIRKAIFTASATRLPA